MDHEFLNVYINKQKSLIDEFQSRILLAESKIHLLEDKHNKNMQHIAALEAKLKQKEEELMLALTPPYTPEPE